MTGSVRNLADFLLSQRPSSSILPQLSLCRFISVLQCLTTSGCLWETPSVQSVYRYCEVQVRQCVWHVPFWTWGPSLPGHSSQSGQRHMDALASSSHTTLPIYQALKFFDTNSPGAARWLIPSPSSPFKAELSCGLTRSQHRDLWHIACKRQQVQPAGRDPAVPCGPGQAEQWITDDVPLPECLWAAFGPPVGMATAVHGTARLFVLV